MKETPKPVVTVQTTEDVDKNKYIIDKKTNKMDNK